MHVKSIQRVLLAAVALLMSTFALVAVTPAQAHAAKAPVATESHLTRNYSAIKYGTAVTFTGWTNQVGQTGHGYPGRVYLQRKIVGQTVWKNVSYRDLSAENATPTWTSKPAASAYYRLHFGGIPDVASPSTSVALKVAVRRNLNDRFRSSDRLYYGKVAPSYGRRTVYIQKSNCSHPRSTSCSWSVFKKLTTNRTSNWSLRLPAYSRTTHFRAYVKPSNGYGGSLSNYFITTSRR